MKKLIILIAAIVLAAGGSYAYRNMMVVNYKDSLMNYRYGLKYGNTFAFANLEIDAIQWLRDHPSDFFKKLALLNDHRSLTLSGWITAGESITSAYLHNDELCSIYIRRSGGLTHIVFKDRGLFNKAIELHSRENSIIKDDLNFSKISYDTFITLPPRSYSALKNLDLRKSVTITTPLAIEDILNTDDMTALLQGEWWLSAPAVSMSLED